MGIYYIQKFPTDHTGNFFLNLFERKRESAHTGGGAEREKNPKQTPCWARSLALGLIPGP